MTQLFANIGDTDQMSYSVASDLGALFAYCPFRGLRTKMGSYNYIILFRG